MSKIVFLGNPSATYDGNFSQIGPNQARLTFDSTMPSDEILLSGFKLINEYNGFVQTRRENYTYVYRRYENDPLKIELCDDGAEYTEPDPVILSDPEPYVPTYEELLNCKIDELSSACQNTIEYGLDINGLHYSYTAEDQINLNDIVNTVKLTGLPLGYHADGQNCTEYTAEELTDIYIQLAMNKYCQQAYFNQAREYLKSLAESEENREIVESYTYGTPLHGVYLETYENMAALYDNQVKAMAHLTVSDEA